MRMRVLRNGVCVFYLWFWGHAWAHAPAPPAPAATLAQALLDVADYMAKLGEPADLTAGYAWCVQHLQPWRDEAFAAPPDDPVALSRAATWSTTMAMCLFSETGNGSPRASVSEVRDWLVPWYELQRHRSKPDPLFEINRVLDYVWQLQLIGYKAEALAFHRQEITARLQALQANPNDSLAADEIAYAVRVAVGHWMRPQEMQQLQSLLEQGLGEGHRQHLLLLRSMAYHQRFSGQPQASLALIERAVALTRLHHPQDRMLNVRMDEEHAASLAEMGQLARAQQILQGVLAAHAALVPVNEFNLMRLETNLAGMALGMSAYDAAIAHADRSIEHAQRSGSRYAEAEARVARAVREEARMWQGATDAPARLRAVLDETQATEMHIGSEAFALVQFAAAQGQSELLDWAVAFTDLQIQRYRGPLQADAALRPLMQAWRTAGHDFRQGEVRSLLDRALALSLNGRSPGTLALTLFNQARERATSDPDTAIWLYKTGANTLQRLRAGLPSSEPELHRAWLGTHEADLRHFIALLIDQGRLIEAEQALAALRDQEGHEYTRRALRQQSGMAGQQLSYTPAEALRDHGLQAAAAQAQRATAQADQRLEGQARPYFRNQYRDEQGLQAVDDLSRQVRTMIDAAPAAARALPASADTTTAVPRGTARLSYFVRDDAVDVVLATARGRQRYTVPVARAALNRLVQNARSSLGSPQDDPLPSLHALHALLLAPLVPVLQGQRIQHLQVVPDAVLRYVPYAALHDGRRYAAQRYTLAVRWSGSVTADPAEPAEAPAAGAAAARHRGGILAVGRTTGDAEHAALPGVQLEMASARRAGGQVLLDAAFTADSLRAALQRRPAMVHMASHFALDPAGEEKSYLLLGDGSKLPLSTLATLPWRGVNLALLSACDSGVVLGQGTGQALVGLASTLQQAGVQHVIATLWRVSDGATASWVQMFYRQPAATALRQPVMPKLNAARVAQTQRDWLRRHAGTALTHPHYWGAFTWLEWR
jgi:CHAT domain-containing protein